LQPGWPKKMPKHSTSTVYAMVNNALKKGIITKPDKCSTCGCISPLIAHHEDYSKPLSVLFVCKSCHKKRHIAINKARKSGDKISNIDVVRVSLVLTIEEHCKIKKLAQKDGIFFTSYLHSLIVKNLNKI
jgi:hypothetical protein